MGVDGQKLSKQNGATALDVSSPVEALQQAARLLQLPRIEALSVSEWLAAATRAWATRWVS
jgi:glutamyl-Q tRNA(Asp) synthetase